MAKIDPDFDIDKFLDDGEPEESDNFKIPDLSLMTDAHLVDTLGRIKHRLKPLGKYEKLLVALFKNREIPSDTRGNRYIASASPSVTTRLNQAIAKETLDKCLQEGYIDQAQYDACWSTSETNTLRIKEL